MVRYGTNNIKEMNHNEDEKKQRILLFLLKSVQEGDGVLTVQVFSKTVICILKHPMLSYSFSCVNSKDILCIYVCVCVCM